MAVAALRPCGDYRTSYRADQTIFATVAARYAVIVAVVLRALLPRGAGKYVLNLLIQIGYLGIAALGLNILVGFTGQISIGHAAFFGFGAFSSAYLKGKLGIP